MATRSCSQPGSLPSSSYKLSAPAFEVLGWQMGTAMPSLWCKFWTKRPLGGIFGALKYISPCIISQRYTKSTHYYLSSTRRRHEYIETHTDTATPEPRMETNTDMRPTAIYKRGSIIHPVRTWPLLSPQGRMDCSLVLKSCHYWSTEKSNL